MHECAKRRRNLNLTPAQHQKLIWTNCPWWPKDRYRTTGRGYKYTVTEIPDQPSFVSAKYEKRWNGNDTTRKWYGNVKFQSETKTETGEFVPPNSSVYRFRCTGFSIIISECIVSEREKNMVGNGNEYFRSFPTDFIPSNHSETSRGFNPSITA